MGSNAGVVEEDQRLAMGEDRFQSLENRGIDDRTGQVPHAGQRHVGFIRSWYDRAVVRAS